MILEGDEEDTYLFTDLEVFVDGILTEITSTDRVCAAVHEFIATFY